ncbi:hypothetical protein PybrP1_006724 [[Pythium] brassicae (nom. inval.)]|nr:hypothetical protein PybrP1_006724 [[Pythium] brassicae (nom. inval.)]
MADRAIKQAMDGRRSAHYSYLTERATVTKIEEHTHNGVNHWVNRQQSEGATTLYRVTAPPPDQSFAAPIVLRIVREEREYVFLWQLGQRATISRHKLPSAECSSLKSEELRRMSNALPAPNALLLFELYDGNESERWRRDIALAADGVMAASAALVSPRNCVDASSCMTRLTRIIYHLHPICLPYLSP